MWEQGRPAHERQLNVVREQRAGEADRDRTIAALREGFALGYLEEEVFDARLAVAAVSHSAAELKSLVSDLPSHVQHVPAVRSGPPRVVTRRMTHTRVAISLAQLVTVWMAMMIAGSTWPANGHPSHLFTGSLIVLFLNFIIFLFRS